MLIYQPTKIVAIFRITNELAHSKYTVLPQLKLNIHIIFAKHNFFSKLATGNKMIKPLNYISRILLESRIPS